MLLRNSLRVASLLATIATLVAATPATAHNPISNASAVAVASRNAVDKPFVLAIVDSLPRHDAAALVVRYANDQREEVVVIRTGATPDAVLGAIAALERMRHANPTASDTRYAFITHSAPVGPVPAKTTERMTRYLNALGRRPIVRIGNLGAGRWIEVNGTGLTSMTPDDRKH